MNRHRKQNSFISRSEIVASMPIELLNKETLCKAVKQVPQTAIPTKLSW